jgi:hypothetical protein
MNPIRVNADYESVLFLNQPAPPIVNESLEFLAFYLDERPVLTSKKYSYEYLSHVEKLIGRKVHLVSKGDSVNWWGELKNLPLEQLLNSKITSTQFLIEQGWIKDLFVIESIEKLKIMNRDQIWLLKNPYLMSGQKFYTLFPYEELKEKNISFPIITEPLLERCFDFSHYFFSEGRSICYENLVDPRFQYKGSKFSESYSLESLSFYHQIKPNLWEQFQDRLSKIVAYYRNLGAQNFSVDSFVYKLEGEFFIYPMCEVNVRRTMGSCAFEIFNTFKDTFKYGAIILKKSIDESFESLKDIESHDNGVIILSPGDTRFNVYLVLAQNQTELRNKINFIQAWPREDKRR